MARLKRNVKVHKLLTELKASMAYIMTSERFRSDKKRISRCVDSWKETCHRAIESEKDQVLVNIIYAIMNSITYHIYDMTPNNAQNYINNHLRILEEIDYDEYVG